MPVPLNPELIKEILSLYEQGWTKKAIAKKLNLHPKTVESSNFIHPKVYLYA